MTTRPKKNQSIVQNVDPNAMDDSEHDTDEDQNKAKNKNADASKNENRQSSNYNNALNLPPDDDSAGKASSPKSAPLREDTVSIRRSHIVPRNNQNDANDPELRPSDEVSENPRENIHGTEKEHDSDSSHKNLPLKPSSSGLPGEKDALKAAEDKAAQNETFVCYIVVEENKIKNATKQSILSIFEKQFPDIFVNKCEQLHAEFPNIWRSQIWSRVKISTSNFFHKIKVDDSEVIVYLNGTCWFFTSINTKCDEKKIQLATYQKLVGDFITTSKVHAQINKGTGNALVLFPSNHISNPTILSLTIGGDKYNVMEKLPVSLSPCVDSSMKDGYGLSGEPYERSGFKGSRAQEVCNIDEINHKNWYSKFSPDTPTELSIFLRCSDKRVFKMKWNPDAFIKEFKACSVSKERCDRGYEDQMNEYRHHIRLTVMINTYGIVENGSYDVNGKKITIDNRRVKTVVFDQNSIINVQKKIQWLDELKPKFKSTEVLVLNEDCVIAYKRALGEGDKPVLLNMANAKKPGGGYRRGDGAQEENIFRRSNYYQSLDADFDLDSERNRYYCDESGEEKKLLLGNAFYPIHAYGAIYTSGLTFFRDVEENGYALLERPIENVSAIAVAAYREPPLTDDNRLAQREAEGTKKKIETVLSVAYRYGHDCVILSALGCGAFRNPPEHVAEIFESVIKQFAGFFKKIYFAIIDDHNSGKDFNPNGNFYPFRKRFERGTYEYRAPTPENPYFGPFFISRTETGAFYICNAHKVQSRTLCRYGAKCHSTHNQEHEATFLHPTLCSSLRGSSTCHRTDDEQHMLWFRHPGVSSHARSMDRPSPDKEVQSAPLSDPICCFTPFSCKLHDQLVDSFDPKSAPKDVLEHCQKYIHICRYGGECLSQSDIHKRMSIHIIREPCQHKEFCNLITDEEHLGSFSHPKVHDIRKICNYPSGYCRDEYKPDHLRKFRHRFNSEQICPIPFRNINSRVDFLKNQELIDNDIKRYMKNKITLSPTIVKEMKSIVRKFRPIYQCSKEVLQILIVTGVLSSNNAMKNLQETDGILDFIIKSGVVEKLIGRQVNQALRDYMRALIETSFSKVNSSHGSYQTDEIEKIERKAKAEGFSRELIEKIQQSVSDLVAVCTKNRSKINAFTDNDSDGSTINANYGISVNCQTEDIVIILRKEIMHHPDSNFSVRPESVFRKNILAVRPWTSEENREKLFNLHKLHCGVMGHEEILANELILTFEAETGRFPSDKDRIFEYLTSMKKQCLEAHLPSFIPSEYIEQIYIGSETYAKIDWFKCTIPREKFIKVDSWSERSYRDTVSRTFLENINLHTTTSSFLIGFSIDLMPSYLENFLTVPFRIDKLSAAWNERVSGAPGSTEIFIYWQSIGGDSMLMLSKDFEISKDAKSLICYIGEPVVEQERRNRNKPSYLYYGYPGTEKKLSNETNMTSNNAFHQGVNVENLMTYCLKLNTRSGEVVLSHAGSNSVYSEEKIQNTFEKDRSSFQDFRFIHVAAGDKMVPIRNLVVRLERIEKLHPRFQRRNPSRKSPKGLIDRAFDASSKFLEPLAKSFGLGSGPEKKFSGESPIGNGNQRGGGAGRQRAGGHDASRIDHSSPHDRSFGSQSHGKNSSSPGDRGGSHGSSSGLGSSRGSGFQPKSGAGSSSSYHSDSHYKRPK